MLPSSRPVHHGRGMPEKATSSPPASVPMSPATPSPAGTSSTSIPDPCSVYVAIRAATRVPSARRTRYAAPLADANATP